MKRIYRTAILMAMTLCVTANAWAQKYDYETVAGDPMKTKIYTLPNGLKVYMSVNKEKPRIQTNIAVKVGSKNDPAETTGLAHYFEHMMFKGSDKFGTANYAAEKPMLDEIEKLFEVYRATNDSTERSSIYHKIDSISFEASKLAIPNEYDKLMAVIGANGTNAYTSYDKTCYVEDIPSNELERWAEIQANRFESPILRGFHTELETIYEEKNMSLTRDSRKMTEGMMAALFPNHPYGQWSVLGHQQHLKNPSITNIKNTHKQWYVPNNMAILMAGDFDPDNAVDIITKYFGHLKPNPNLPKLDFTAEAPITEPVTKEVYGLEAEALILAWRFPKASSPEIETLDILDAILNNGKAGLIDLNINKKQLAMSVGTGAWQLSDYTAYLIQGRPKQGQTLEEVQDLILAELAKLRNGEFDESLIAATINNYKLSRQNQIESNENRVDIMEHSFINDIALGQIATALDRQSKLTKKDIVEFANKYLRDDNYVAIYKRQGKDTTELKINKPAITPIVVNRENKSDFLTEITNEKVSPIEPVFMDFNKDIDHLKLKNGSEVLYKKNETNELFNLTILLHKGTDHDKRFRMLQSYFPMMRTKSMTNEEIAQKFYELACSYMISTQGDETYLIVNGLSENMPKALALVEDIIANAVPDQETYTKIAERTIKSRDDSRKNQNSNFSHLRSYIMYGPEQLKQKRLSNDEVRAIDPKVLTEALKDFQKYEQTIIYYGPMEQGELVAMLNKVHKTDKKLKKVEKGANPYTYIQPKETVFYIAPYDAKQLYMCQFTTEGKNYDPEFEPGRTMYNEYFGGGMNGVVFQEMRERRSLAYSANAYMSRPSKKDEPYAYVTTIATQNDKLADAIEAFDEIIEDMPVSQNAFNLAKTGLEARLRSERSTKYGIAWSYLQHKKLGRDTDMNKQMFETLPSITLEDVIKFQLENVKGGTYHIGILGDPANLDLDYLKTKGKVVILTTDDIFGY